VKSDDWFSKLVGKLVRTADYMSSILRQNYTMAERVNLVRASVSRGHETKLLNFRVTYLSEGAFRTQLREIFFEGEYRFDAAWPRCSSNTSTLSHALLLLRQTLPRHPRYKRTSNRIIFRTSQRTIYFSQIPKAIIHFMSQPMWPGASG
jgi:hypothetical protein